MPEGLWLQTDCVWMYLSCEIKQGTPGIWDIWEHRGSWSCFDPSVFLPGVVVWTGHELQPIHYILRDSSLPFCSGINFGHIRS